jgi:Uncharacterized conserved protein
MSEIIRVLRREHANMLSLVKALEWHVAEFERGGRPDYEVIRAAVDYFLGFPDLYHHPKEDMIFAVFEERDSEAAWHVGDLRREHEVIAARTRELSAGLNVVLEEAQVPRESFVRWARAFTDLQLLHMRMEEEVFFPAALKVLTEEDWAGLEAQMTSDEDPLFGENVGARFETLRETILRWQAEHKHG